MIESNEELIINKPNERIEKVKKSLNKQKEIKKLLFINARLTSDLYDDKEKLKQLDRLTYEYKQLYSIIKSESKLIRINKKMIDDLKRN